jgi:hypothetical protein
MAEADKARIARARAEYDRMKVSAPGSYHRSFDQNEYVTAYAARAEIVKGLVLALQIIQEGEFKADYEMKAYTTQTGGSSWGGDRRELKDVCCSSEDWGPQGGRVSAYVDMGISLHLDGRPMMRLNGDKGDIHSTPPLYNPDGSLRKNPLIPHFVRVLTGNHSHVDDIWDGVLRLLPDTVVCEDNQEGYYESFCRKYDTLVAELAPRVKKHAERHVLKTEKARERAARPDVVAKREGEARARGRESLSKLLGGPRCKKILDKWGPEDLLTYLRLCQEHEMVLKALMRWSGQNPLGSRTIELEDVTNALEMAKVRDVMDS